MVNLHALLHYEADRSTEEVSWGNWGYGHLLLY